jgi:hypothetical protein
VRRLDASLADGGVTIVLAAAPLSWAVWFTFLRLARFEVRLSTRMSPTLISLSVPGRPCRMASGSQAAGASRSGKVMALTVDGQEEAANNTVI